MGKTLIPQREPRQVGISNPEFAPQNIGALRAFEQGAEAVRDLSIKIADEELEHRAAVENSKATAAAIGIQNDIVDRKNEYRDKAIEDGFDPETDEGRAEIIGRMRGDYLRGMAEVVGSIETRRGSRRFQLTYEKLAGNFDVDTAAVGRSIQRDHAVTNATKETETLAKSVRANITRPNTSLQSLAATLSAAEDAWEARGQHLSASEKKKALDAAKAQVRSAYVASINESAFADPQAAKDFIRNPAVRAGMVERGFSGGEVDALEQNLISFSQQRNYETTLRRIRDKDGDLNPLNTNLTLDEIAGNHRQLQSDLSRMLGDDLSIGQVEAIEASMGSRAALLSSMLAAQDALDNGLALSADLAPGLDALSQRVLSDPNTTTEQKDHWLVTATTTAGYMPRGVAQQLSAGFRGDIPEMVRSKALLDRLVATNPSIARDAIDKEHSLDADAGVVYQKMTDLDYLGAEESAALAQELLRGKAQDTAEVERRKQQFNETIAGLPKGANERDFVFADPDADTPLAQGFRDHMDSSFDVGGLGIGIFVEPNAREDMFQHYAQTYRELASVYGFDDGSVSKRAWEMTLASYGQSEFGVPQGALAFDGKIAEILGIEPGRAIDQNIFSGVTGAGPVDNIIARLEPYTHEAPLVRKPIEAEFERAGMNALNGRRDMYLEIRESLPEKLRDKLTIEETWFRTGIGDRNIKFDGRRVFVRYNEVESERTGRASYDVLVDGLGAIGQPLPGGPSYYQPPLTVQESMVFQRHGQDADFDTFGDEALRAAERLAKEIAGKGGIPMETRRKINRRGRR